MDRTEDALALAARAEGSDLQPEWLYLRANCLRRLDRDEEALKLYERLISDHPDHALTAAAGYETALMAFRAGDYAAVLDRLAPETAAPQVQAEAYWLVAEAARELERDKQAAEYYRWIVENAGDAGRHAQALYRLGRLAADAGTHDKASQHFRQLVETYPDHELSPQALFESGLSLLRAEAVDEAVADWTDLVKRYPSSPYAERSLYQKALAEVGLDAGERAIKSFRALLLRFPDTVHEVEANYWMGVLHEREDRLEKAEEHLRAALEAEPEDDWLPRVQYHLAAVLQKNGKLEEAAGLLQDVLQSPMREDMPSPLLEWLAVYELDAKAWDNALSAARQLISAGETPAWRQIGYYLLGRAELGRGANMEARRAFKDALEQGADTREGAAAALEWGRLALRFEDFEEAAEAFQAAASKAVADELMDVRAQAYAGLGDAAAGREAWEDAARYYLSVGLLFDDENIVPGALYKAVEAFERAGLFKESREALQVLRERYPESEWALRRAPESE
jgi:TolA-binding protein